jgi:hypothetical protein
MKADSKEIEFVFIQLGVDLPPHLFQNLRLVHEMFPLTRINLVTSKRVIIGYEIAEFVSQTEYESTPELDELLNVKSRNPSFRKGFWRYSLERLFAIAYLHEQRPDKSLLHIESDVLLLQGFPLKKFINVEKIAWMSVDSKKDIASLMFFPDVAASQIFLDDLLDFVTNATSPTDMTALNHLRLKDPSRYWLLPTWDPGLPELHSNSTIKSNTEPVFSGGVFDAAGIGMWLTGFDPRNSYGFTKYFATSDLKNAGFYIDPSAYTLEFSKEGKLFYKNDPYYIQVYNLHIHSKSLRIFSLNRNKELSRLTQLSTRGRPHREFRPRVLSGLIRSNFREGTLLAFLFYSPPFKMLRLAYTLTKKSMRGL